MSIAKIYSDQSRRIDWTVREDTDATLTITVTDNSVAYDLSSTTFVCEFFEVGSSTAFLTLTQGSGLTNGGAAGTLTIALTDTQLNLTPNDYWWKLRTTAPTDYLWFNGIFRVNGYLWDGGTDYSVSVALTVANNEININLVAASTSGGGSGTVTSFSAGNLTPLFTSSVANATTTPALTFAQITKNANTVFAGPTSGGAANPDFRALVAADIPDLSSVYDTAGLANILQGSGVLTGGVLSIGTGGAGVATTFSITSGTGLIIDNTVSPITRTSVSWTTKTDVAVTNILTDLITYVAIDSGGNVIQSTTDFTPAQMRQYIVIGIVVHSDLTTVNAVNQTQVVAYNPGNQFSDLLYSLGLFNVSGNIFSANGANLKINKSAGSLFRRGANYSTLTDNPHLITTGSLTQASLRMQNQTGAGSSSTTDVDVANYDVAGVTTAISPSSRFSILRVFLFQSNLVAVQRGQAIYQSLAEAKAAIQTEPFVTNTILAANGLLRGFIVAQASATSLNDTSKVFFIDAGKFGGTNGVGGLSVSTLQNAYDNSSTPEILTDSTRGAVSVKRGSAADTDAVIEVLNGAGSTVATITGEGNVTVADEAYGAGWNASTEAPTKNAVYDKIETLSPKVIGIAVSDETTALTTGTAKVTFRMPYAMTLTAVRASLVTAQTSGNIFTVDINESGTTILSTKLTIDNTEKTSTTAATPPVISDTSLADDAEITVDIDQIGDGTAKGLKIWLIG